MKKWNIDFYGNRKLYFTITSILLAIMLISSFVFGVELDIQFKGGALITYSYNGEINRDEFQKTVESLLETSTTIQETTDVVSGFNSFVVSIPSGGNINTEKQQEIYNALNEKFPNNSIETASVNVVNPTIGSEFLAKSLVAVLSASLLMILYISIRFKKISGWSAGITAVVALINDVLMVFASFVIFNMPLNANFIAVCLTILGYSLNDTIVVYDRIRENKRITKDMPVEEMVNLSLNQSLTRTFMTSLTTITAMVTVSVIAVIYNVSSILSFSLPMIVGMVSGFYTSMCIAPTLWVIWQKKIEEKK